MATGESASRRMLVITRGTAFIRFCQMKNKYHRGHLSGIRIASKTQIMASSPTN